jgi:hypothetical protein
MHPAGHIPAHLPQPTHIEGSTFMKRPPSELMADMGHSWKHAPQQTHMSLLILATFFEFMVFPLLIK